MPYQYLDINLKDTENITIPNHYLMKLKNFAVVFDCGATNVRVIAIDTSGKILASKAMTNETEEDPYFHDGRI